jgi:gamma-glutamyltranspeptidase
MDEETKRLMQIDRNMTIRTEYESVSAAATPDSATSRSTPRRGYYSYCVSVRDQPWFPFALYSGVFLAGALVSFFALRSNFVINPFSFRHGSTTTKLYVQRHSAAAVAADHVPCSILGRTVLEEYGGNAVDASVVVGLCLGVVNPSSSGLGGGAFATVYLKESNVTVVIDCREEAPGAATQDMFQNVSSEYGGLATSVPGELHCYADLHSKYGVLPWREVVMIVADFAAAGTVVGEYLAETIGSLAGICQHNVQNIRCQIAADSGYSQILTKGGGNNWARPLKHGDTLYQPALVATLRAIAEDGVSAFYESERTEQMVQDIVRQGGIVSLDDMKAYRAKWRDPVVANIGDLTIASIPPPSSGGAAVIGTLRFLSLVSSSLATFPDTLAQHRLVEGWKHIFAIRMSLSDPDYNTETVEDAVADLVSSSYVVDTLLSSSYYDENNVQHLSMYGGPKWALLSDDGSESSDSQQNIQDQHEGDRRSALRVRLLNNKDPLGYLNDGGTSHFCVVDRMGNAVSMTTSINTNFGSHVYSPSTGIVFSNTMDDFSMPGETDHFGVHPSEANYIVPTKRPLSSMSPTLIFYKDELLLAVGASGGPKIISAVSQVIMRHLLLGQPIDEAVAHPRLHNQLIYHGASVTNVDNVYVDKYRLLLNVSDVTRNALLRRGQTLLDVDYTGAVQAIAIDRDTGQLVAVCDPRKGGIPAGY